MKPPGKRVVHKSFILIYFLYTSNVHASFIRLILIFYGLRHFSRGALIGFFLWNYLFVFSIQPPLSLPPTIAFCPKRLTVFEHEILQVEPRFNCFSYFVFLVLPFWLFFSKCHSTVFLFRFVFLRHLLPT